MLLVSQGAVNQELDQQSGADAGRSLGKIRALPFTPVGAGNVEVYPWAIADELAEEQSGSDHAASPSPDIAHIGDVAP